MDCDWARCCGCCAGDCYAGLDIDHRLISIFTCFNRWASISVWGVDLPATLSCARFLSMFHFGLYTIMLITPAILFCCLFLGSTYTETRTNMTSIICYPAFSNSKSRLIIVLVADSERYSKWPLSFSIRIIVHFRHSISFLRFMPVPTPGTFGVLR